MTPQSDEVAPSYLFCPLLNKIHQELVFFRLAQGNADVFRQAKTGEAADNHAVFFQELHHFFCLRADVDADEVALGGQHLETETFEEGLQDLDAVGVQLAGTFHVFLVAEGGNCGCLGPG